MSAAPTDPGREPPAVSWGRFEDRPGHLIAEVDIDLEVTDTTGRATVGRLVGTGHRLRLTVAHPDVIAAAGRGAIRAVAGRLADTGVRAELHGPRRRIARIDPGRTSRVGALLTGSPHVILDRTSWSLPARALRTHIAALPGPQVAGVVVALGVALIAVVRVRRSPRRRAHGSDVPHRARRPAHAALHETENHHRFR